MALKVDWANVLTELGIDIPRVTDQFNIACPFHADIQPSLSINLERGVWICHAGCGEGSLKSFLKNMLDVSWHEVNQYLTKRYATFDVDIFADITEEVVYDETIEFPFSVGFVPPWIFDRGFTATTLRKWGCAVDDGDLIIPVKNQDGAYTGWISRRLYLTPKYLYSKGFKKARNLFGINFITSSDFICLTEGSLDAMWLDQYGYNALALLGAHMSQYQENLLMTLPTKEVVLCLDNDTAGKTATDNILTRLSNRCIVSVVTVPEGYKDVQDIKDEKLLATIIQQRTLW